MNLLPGTSCTLYAIKAQNLEGNVQLRRRADMVEHHRIDYSVQCTCNGAKV
jgi:hypothetical protein